MCHRLLAAAPALLLFAIAGCGAPPPPATAATVSERAVLAHALPASFGARPHVEVFEVTYGPGGSTRPHRHSCPVVGYVLQGSVRMQLEGRPEQVYGPGMAFYEDPTDLHLVSANASQDTEARFLAFFVCDEDRPLFVPVPPGKGGRGER